MSENKYTYDEIIASAYYVFREGLTTRIIASFLVNLKKLGIIYHREESKLKELKGLIVFNGANYTLSNDSRMSDIIPFVKNNLVLIFESLKASRDNYYLNADSRMEKEKVKKIGSKNES